jgi:hypothetical protein
MDTAQLADMLYRQGVPEEYIWEFIYKFQDPKGMKDRQAVELFEKSPDGLRLRAIQKLIKEGREEEANTLIEELFADFKQRQSAQAPQGLQSPQGETIT